MNYGSLISYALNSGVDVSYKAFSPEAFAKALEVTVLGMAMVFSVLAILWGVLALFKVIFAGGGKKNKKDNKAAFVEVAKPTVVESTVAEEPVAEENDDVLIAVITAAVAAYRASEENDTGDNGGFRVVSFKRAGSPRAWNKKNG